MHLSDEIIINIMKAGSTIMLCGMLLWFAFGLKQIVDDLKKEDELLLKGE